MTTENCINVLSAKLDTKCGKRKTLLSPTFYIIHSLMQSGEPNKQTGIFLMQWDNEAVRATISPLLSHYLLSKQVAAGKLTTFLHFSPSLTSCKMIFLKEIILAVVCSRLYCKRRRVRCQPAFTLLSPVDK